MVSIPNPSLPFPFSPLLPLNLNLNRNLSFVIVLNSNNEIKCWGTDDLDGDDVPSCARQARGNMHARAHRTKSEAVRCSEGHWRPTVADMMAVFVVPTALASGRLSAGGVWICQSLL